MSVALIMLGIALALLAGFVAFYRHSRTPEWVSSDTRRALLNVVVAIGPFFGMHYRPPRPSLPGIMTPGPEGGDDPLPWDGAWPEAADAPAEPDPEEVSELPEEPRSDPPDRADGPR